jgi:hypothetical protein
MHRHPTNAASFLSVVITALLFSFSLAGIAAAQGGLDALVSNSTGDNNTATGAS